MSSSKLAKRSEMPEQFTPENLTVILEQHFRPRLEDLLPEGVKPAAFLRNLANVIEREPKLQQCSPASVLDAAIDAATVGALPGTSYSSMAWILPIKKGGTFVADLRLSYLFLLQLMLDHPAIADIHIQLVYKQDVFNVEYSPSFIITHRPGVHPMLDEDIVGVWAKIYKRNGFVHQKWLPAEYVNKKHRDRSPRWVKNSPGERGPWETDYGIMVCKSILREIYKEVEHSAKLDQAVDRDIRADEGIDTFLTRPAEDLVKVIDLTPAQPAEPAMPPEQAEQTAAEQPAHEPAIPAEGSEHPPAEVASDAFLLTPPIPAKQEEGKPKRPQRAKRQSSPESEPQAQPQPEPINIPAKGKDSGPAFDLGF